jgi:predicted Zn-dependent peptidase
LGKTHSVSLVLLSASHKALAKIELQLAFSNSMKRFVYAALLAILPVCLFSQSLEEFRKNVTEFKLANGMHFIVVERHEAPVVAFHTYVNVGAVDDPGGETGLAHMFEHMAFKGTEQIGTKDWPKEKQAMERLEVDYDSYDAEKNKGLHANQELLKTLWDRVKTDIDAAQQYVIPNQYPQIIEMNGGEGLNAETGLDATQYFYKFPSNRLELWFLLESERFYDPVFREFYKERDVVREERRMRVESEPQGLLQESFLAAAFEAHPYHHSPGGWASDIENLRLSEAIRFYKTYYVPSNISMAIVGDVDPKQARELAEKYFSVIPKKENPPPVHTIEPRQEGERRVEIDSQSQPLEIVGYKRPDQLSDDDAVFDVMSEVLSGGRTGTIYKDLVRDKQLALAAGSAPTFPSGKYPNLFLLYIAPNMGKSLDECEAELYRVVDELKTQKVDQTTLNRVKTKVRADLIRQLDNNAGLAAQLNFYYVAYGDWQKLFTQLSEYDKISADDVMRVAKKYLTPETRTVARLVPAPTEKPGPSGPATQTSGARN